LSAFGLLRPLLTRRSKRLLDLYSNTFSTDFIYTSSFHRAHKILFLDRKQQPPPNKAAPLTYQPTAQAWHPAGTWPVNICLQVMLMASLPRRWRAYRF